MQASRSLSLLYDDAQASEFRQQKVPTRTCVVHHLTTYSLCSCINSGCAKSARFQGLSGPLLHRVLSRRSATHFRTCSSLRILSDSCRHLTTFTFYRRINSDFSRSKDRFPGPYFFPEQGVVLSFIALSTLCDKLWMENRLQQIQSSFLLVQPFRLHMPLSLRQ